MPVVIRRHRGIPAASPTTTTGPRDHRRSILIDAKADILIYGNAERPLVEVAHRIAGGETIETMQDIRGTASHPQGAAAGLARGGFSKARPDCTIDPSPAPMEGAPCSDDEGTAPVGQAKPILKCSP